MKSTERAKKPAAESKTETVTLMTPDMGNFGGNVHGGHVLRLIDQIAYVCASQYSGHYCVTRSVDKVGFRVPVRVGDLLSLQARVNYVGRTSMEVGVRAESRDVRTGEARHTNSCYLTMIALDDDRRPTPVPPLICESDEDRRRFAEASRRRQRARLIREAEESETRHRALIDAAEVPILLAEAEEGHVVDANQRARKLLGRDETQLAQTPVWNLFEDAQAGRAQFDRVLRRGFTEGEHALRSEAGTRQIRLTAFLIPVPGIDLVQFVLHEAG